MGLKPTSGQIHSLNIGLMVLSAAMAFTYPFELFLSAYAILGPLHYLTEISWLHDRNYLTKGKYDHWFLLAAGLAITLLALGAVQGAPPRTGELLTFLAFAASFLFLFQGNVLVRLGILLLAGLAAVFLFPAAWMGAIFGLFLPTLIHVFLFTGLFILVGALRERSFPGILSLLVFLAIGMGFYFFHPEHAQYRVPDYVRENYGYWKGDGSGSGLFITLNYFLVTAFGIHDFGQPTQPLSEYLAIINSFLYHNPAALALMSFIAFAYTYHYLNWFSKTSIIRWHEVSKGRTLTILLAWLASLILYGLNYKLGFQWLFFLSFAHVLLEFPLNHLTFLNIAKELKKIIMVYQNQVLVSY